MSATLRGARAWLDEDGEHIWMEHWCSDRLDVSMYPHPRWRAVDGVVAPSFQCDKCGFHSILPLAARLRAMVGDETPGTGERA